LEAAHYRDVVSALGRTGQCEIHSLYAEGRCLGALLAVFGREECEGVKVGYDEDYARLMPGKLLFESLLKRCCDDEAVLRLNTLSETAWLPSWGAISVPIERAAVSLGGARGRALVTLFRLQWFARTVVLNHRARRASEWYTSKQ